MLDWEMFKDSAGRHHMINMLFHMINSLLVFFVFKRMTKTLWQSAVIAALFAIHPAHVESVAWASERKDVLSAMFWLLTMGAYLFYTEKRSIKWYLLMLLSFAIGLMAKPMLVTLPFVLLLMDYWPLKRLETFSFKKALWLVTEKIPLFLLTVASSVITYIVQQKGGAMVDTKVIMLADRITNTLVSYVKYIAMMFWPTKLAMYYPYALTEPYLGYAAAALLVAITFLVFLLGRRYKYLPVGWLWYLGTLIPVIGLVQVGMQSLADRYTYIPYIGLFIMIAWGVSDISAKWKNRKPILTLTTAAVVLSLTATAYIQTGYWHDSIKLFERALAVTEKNGRMHNNLCVVYNRQENFTKALYHGLKAVQFDPDSDNAYYNLGIVYYRTGQMDKAIDCWEETVKINPEFNKAHNNLGAMYYKQGKTDLAIKHWRKALEVDPDDINARQNLEQTLAEKNNTSKKPN